MFFLPLISLFSTRHGRWGFSRKLVWILVLKLIYHFGTRLLRGSRVNQDVENVLSLLICLPLGSTVILTCLCNSIKSSRPTTGCLLGRLTVQPAFWVLSLSFTTHVYDKVVPRMPSWTKCLKVCALSSVVPAGLKPCAFRCFGSCRPVCFGTLNPCSCSVNSVKLTFLPCLPSHS